MLTRCHAGRVPCAESMEAFLRAAAEFVVADLELEAEPSAVDAARRSLDDSGLLLLGEVHGVSENPLLIRALMQAFGLTSLALEWPDDLAPAVAAFLAGKTLPDHPMLWPGDGRITAGHLAVLAERAAAGPLELTLFDGTVETGWSWSRRDEAMAARILASGAAGIATLVVAGNAHTPIRPIELGVPMGARLARRRPGVREISINYCGGHYYNLRSARFAPTGPQHRELRLYQHDDALVLDLPSASEAIVPQR
jgi:erythromycin esterase-like protein